MNSNCHSFIDRLLSSNECFLFVFLKIQIPFLSKQFNATLSASEKIEKAHFLQRCSIDCRTTGKEFIPERRNYAKQKSFDPTNLIEAQAILNRLLPNSMKARDHHNQKYWKDNLIISYPSRHKASSQNTKTFNNLLAHMVSGKSKTLHNKSLPRQQLTWKMYKIFLIVKKNISTFSNRTIQYNCKIFCF